MVSCNPLTGKWDVNEWDAWTTASIQKNLVFQSQNWSRFHSFCFWLFLEYKVSVKTKHSTLASINMYLANATWKKADRKQGKQQFKGPISCFIFKAALALHWCLGGCLFCHKYSSQTSRLLNAFSTDIFKWRCQCSGNWCQFRKHFPHWHCIAPSYIWPSGHCQQLKLSNLLFVI